MPPDSDRPQHISFTPADAEEIKRVQLELIRHFGSTRGAAAANIVAVGLAKARGITLEQHIHEVTSAHRQYELYAAGGGNA